MASRPPTLKLPCNVRLTVCFLGLVNGFGALLVGLGGFSCILERPYATIVVRPMVTPSTNLPLYSPSFNVLLSSSPMTPPPLSDHFSPTRPSVTVCLNMPLFA